MRYILFLCLTIMMSCTAHSQGQRYSVKDKKAISLYEEAFHAYGIGLNEEANNLLEKAISKNEAFIEPYILRAQIFADEKQTEKAIEDLKAAASINVDHAPNILYFLGELQQKVGDFDDAKKSYEEYLTFSSISGKLAEKAGLGIRSCDFAKYAIQNPVEFEPINMGEQVNSDLHEYFPCMTADGSTLLYTRELPDNRNRSGSQEDFFISTQVNDKWEKSIPLSQINTPRNEGAPTLSVDGQFLIFTSCEDETGSWGNYTGKGRCDLFYSYLSGENWGQPKNLGTVNSYDWDSQPSFSADGRTLYFVRGKSTGTGVKEQDIWTSYIGDDGAWTKPTRIKGKVNTPFEEESVMIHPDGETLYFSSNGHVGIGGLDIYMSKKSPDGTWGEPVNLGYPINTTGDENSLLVTAQGDVALFASDREGGFGGLDLYSFEMPVHLRPNKVTYVKGKVFDAKSFKPLEAKFELIDLGTGNTVVEAYSDSKNGEFLVCLPANREYALNAQRPGYLFYSDHYSLIGVDMENAKDIEVPLLKLKAGNSIVLKNVFFDTNSAVLKSTSKVELNTLANLLMGNPSVRVEIAGHTDNIGSDQDNLVLSKNRAEAVVKYLVGQGVVESQLTFNGYGETVPIASNDTDAGRAQNRRTEFKIVE